MRKQLTQLNLNEKTNNLNSVGLIRKLINMYKKQICFYGIVFKDY